MRLKGAFQFKDYKYTKADIVIYDEAIKVLDNFAGEYIKEWLSNLSIIINNLLQPINLSVEFTADKDFMQVLDNQQMLKYDQLSTGQKCFLSVIFKLAILMQQNKTGLVIMDDGLNNLDRINLTNLINICNTLPFQIIAVYQSKVEIEGIKQFLVTRQNGESKVD
jgi:wobble nucleotide-excising tRNase